MNTLKAKIMLLLLVLATVTALPAKLHAGGDPFPDPWLTQTLLPSH